MIYTIKIEHTAEEIKQACTALSEEYDLTIDSTNLAVRPFNLLMGIVQQIKGFVTINYLESPSIIEITHIGGRKNKDYDASVEDFPAKTEGKSPEPTEKTPEVKDDAPVEEKPKGKRGRPKKTEETPEVKKDEAPEPDESEDDIITKDISSKEPENEEESEENSTDEPEDDGVGVASLRDSDMDFLPQ
jgi:hypothetical protein